MSSLSNFKFLFVVGLVCFSTNAVSAQAYKASIGYNDLVAEKGAALEDGTGILVTQVEAPQSGNYMPNVADAQFTGKTFILGSGASGTSGHANTVGQFIYGNSSSMAPGVTNITGYEAGDYLFNLLGVNSGNDPQTTTAFDVGNHSYIANGFSTAAAESTLERFDFVVNRDNTVMVVGANNKLPGSDDTIATPQLLAPSYNSITVGVSSSRHSDTLTSVYGAPRFATAIVVPDIGTTSVATGIVSGAAALLREAGGTSNFIQNEVIRATLFAGATKQEFPSWDRTATRPMDEVFGFGELNILNSYHIFEGGEFNGETTNPATDVALLGWDYGNYDGSNQQLYDFTIGSGLVGEVSAVLSWNMEITDTNPGATFTAQRSLADLNLELFDSSGSYMGLLLDESNGTAYNNEHIFFQNLLGGNYTMRVSGDLATDYGFAWNITTSVPEPSSVVILGLVTVGMISRRRKSTIA